MALPKVDLKCFSRAWRSVNKATLSSYQMRGSSPNVNMNSLMASTSLIFCASAPLGVRGGSARKGLPSGAWVGGVRVLNAKYFVGR